MSSSSSSSESPQRPSSSLRAFRGASFLLTALTFPLIGLGAVVRLKGAGLACPDWPLCYGKVTPLTEVVTPAPAGLGIALEVGHRYVAGAVGLLMLALLVWAWRSLRVHKRVVFWATAAFVLLVPQVVLGGLTVLMKLAPETVSLHLLFGNLFFTSLVVLTVRASQALRGGVVAPEGSRRDAFAYLAVGVLGLTFVQIFLGGLVSSTGASMACSSFPGCEPNAFLPPSQGSGVALQMIHRAVGTTLSLGLIAQAIWSFRRVAVDGTLRVMSCVVVGLVGLQIAVGWWNIANLIPTPTSALHTAIAASIAGSMAFLAARAWDLRVQGSSDVAAVQGYREAQALEVG